MAPLGNKINNKMRSEQPILLLVQSIRKLRGEILTQVVQGLASQSPGSLHELVALKFKTLQLELKQYCNLSQLSKQSFQLLTQEKQDLEKLASSLLAPLLAVQEATARCRDLQLQCNTWKEALQHKTQEGSKLIELLSQAKKVKTGEPPIPLKATKVLSQTSFGTTVQPKANARMSQLELQVKQLQSQLRCVKEEDLAKNGDVKEQYAKKIKSIEADYLKRLKMVEEDTYRKAMQEVERKEVRARNLESRLKESNSAWQSEVSVWEKRLALDRQEHEMALKAMAERQELQILSIRQLIKNQLEEEYKKKGKCMEDVFKMKEESLLSQIEEGRASLQRQRLAWAAKEGQSVAQNQSKVKEEWHARVAQLSGCIKRQQFELASKQLQLRRLREDLQSRKEQFFDKNYRSIKERDRLQEAIKEAERNVRELSDQNHELQARLIQTIAAHRKECESKDAYHNQVANDLQSQYQRCQERTRQEMQQFARNVQERVASMKRQNETEVEAMSRQVELAQRLVQEQESRCREESQLACRIGKELQHCERDNRNLKEAVRDLRLELQNKEKIYNRIFCGEEQTPAEGVLKDRGGENTNSVRMKKMVNQNQSLVYEYVKRKSLMGKTPQQLLPSRGQAASLAPIRERSANQRDSLKVVSIY